MKSVLGRNNGSTEIREMLKESALPDERKIEWSCGKYSETFAEHMTISDDSRRQQALVVILKVLYNTLVSV